MSKENYKFYYSFYCECVYKIVANPYKCFVAEEEDIIKQTLQKSLGGVVVSHTPQEQKVGGSIP